jgi:hypothetical protein
MGLIPSGAGLFATGIHVPAAVARQGWATVKTVAASQPKGACRARYHCRKRKNSRGLSIETG